jgi:hypothetical protein
LTFLDLRDCDAGEDDMSDIHLSLRFRCASIEDSDSVLGRMAPAMSSSVVEATCGVNDLPKKQTRRDSPGGDTHPHEDT